MLRCLLFSPINRRDAGQFLNRSHAASSLAASIVAIALAAIGPGFVFADEPDKPPGEIRILPVEREKPQAATVRLRNGLLLSGMVSTTTTLAPLPASGRAVDRIEQKLLVRLIHQGSREIYVPPRRTDPPVPDVNAWPAQSFSIPRTKQRREARPTHPAPTQPL
ncbi:MAG UNVERIFIED_CONTAM: hypothetical protein LVR18_05305 [Planctomycetaceae bacterium]